MLLLCILSLQAVVVSSSFYLGTDDWMMLSLGRDGVGVESLFDRQTTGTPAIRPVSILLARGEYALFGDAASPRLLFHVLLHGMAALLLLWAALGVGFSARKSGLAALLFAAFPVHGEVLAWYHSGHTAIPVAVFSLAVIAGHARRWPISATLGLLIVALLTRESAVVVAPVALWISVRRSREFKAALADCAPILVVVTLFVILRAWQISTALSGDSNAFLAVDGNPVVAVGYILFQLFIPVHPGITGAWVWLAGFAAAGLYAFFTQRKVLGAVALWIALWVVPYLPLYPTDDSLFEATASSYERRWYYLYLPSIGVVWLLTMVTAERLKLAAIALVLCLALQLQNASWWVELGHGARSAHDELEVLVKKGQALVFDLGDNPTALTEILEHQLVDTPRIFHHLPPVPIFRKKTGDEGLMRAIRDPFDYPIWVELDRPDRIPANAIRVKWDQERGLFQWDGQ
jgi:hypothetical protein